MTTADWATTMETDDFDAGTLLEQARNEIFVRLIPIIILMASFGFVGLLGNILTITFYVGNVKRSPSAVQITCLAGADLVVCVMIIPNILEMVFNVSYDQAIICKFTHFFGYWSICASSLILWIIAIDRYRRICKPFVAQITVKKTKKIIAAVLTISCTLSIRNFVTFDATEVKVKDNGRNMTLTGRYCTPREDAGYKISASVFYAIDVILVLTCWVTLIVTYSLVICTLIKVKHAKKSSRTIAKDFDSGHSVQDDSEYSTDLLDSRGISSTTSAKWNNGRSHIAEKSSSVLDVRHGQTEHPITLHNPASHSSTPDLVKKMVTHASTPDLVKKVVTMAMKGKRRRPRKIAARSRHERSLTFMMLTVSFLFIVCMTPYFVIRIFMRIVLKSGKEYELGVDKQFALRFVYLNSVFNPLVYCFFNPQFRKYIKEILLKCCQRKRNNTMAFTTEQPSNN